MVFKYWFSAVVCIVLISLALPAYAASPGEAVKEGNRLYKQAMYADAAKLYGGVIQDKRQATVAHYNLGNALYKNGKAREDADIDGAIKDMEQSVSNYNEALKNNAKDEDARYNAAFVQKELERLKKKKEEQKKQEQEQKQQKKDQDKKDKPQDKKQDQNKDQKQEQPQDQKGDDQKDKQEEQKKDPKEGKSPGEQDQKDDAQDEQGADMRPGEISPKEAKDILEDYQRNQEPKGLLNFTPQRKTEKPVAKDW